MTKETKPNWSSFTKAELIKTIKALDRRQTTLLNQIAKLEAGRDAVAKVVCVEHDTTAHTTQSDVDGLIPTVYSEPPTPFPWNASLPNSFDQELE